MRRLILVFVVLGALAPVPAFAADMTSQQAAQLAASTDFQHRLAILLDAEAMAVLREPGATANHDQRATLAKNILFSPDSYAATLAKEVVFDTNLISAGVTTDANSVPVDSAATDAAIRSQIATDWSIWCGIPQ